MAALSTRTRWGGLADGCFAPSGFFRSAERDGVWWLIDPDGGRFLSKGVDTVRFDQDRIQNTDRFPYAEACARKYPGKDAWRAAAARRLLSFGFNTLGAWSDEAVGRAGPSPLALTPNLDLGAVFAARREAETGSCEAFPDVFDPGFDIHALQRARELCAAKRDDPSVIGWFTDNELRWGPDWRGNDELLTICLNWPEASAGRQAAIQLLRERYRDIGAFNDVWRTAARSWEALFVLAPVAAPYQVAAVYARNEAAERQYNAADPGRAAFVADCEAFTDRIASRYFEATTAAVKGADPNHTVLGCRFAYVPQPAVIAAAARSLDIVSFNCYGDDPLGAIEAYATTGRPCLVGEFSFRGDDSGLPNTIGAAPRVPTQRDRARCFRRYATAGLRQRTLVGYHWFEHADQPFEGRPDGENSNYGVVTIRDDVYRDLAQAMTAVNGEAEQIHGIAAQLAA